MRTELEFLVKANTQKLDELNRRIEEYERQARKSAVASEKLDTATIAMTASMAAGAIAIYGISRAFSESIRQAEEFEQGIIGVQKTTGLSGKELSKLEKEIFQLGTTIKGVKTSELLNIAQTAGQLGIKGVDNLRSFTETIAMVGVATDLTAEQAATSFAQLQNILGITTKELGRLGSVFNEVSNNSTALVSDLVEFTSRIGGAGKTIGLTYDQIIGLSAALKDTGNNFEVGGSAVSRALISMISDTQKFANVTNVSFEEFSNLVRNRPVEAVKLFINQLNRLDKEGRISALKEVGLDGIEASSVFLKLAEGASKVEENLATANREFNDGSSLLNEYNAASRASIASTERFYNVLDQFQSKLATPFLGLKKDIVDLSSGMILVFDEGFNQIGFRIDDLQARFGRLTTGTMLELAKSARATFGEAIADNIGASEWEINRLQNEFDEFVEKNKEIGRASEESLKKYRELTEEILSGTKKINEQTEKTTIKAVKYEGESPQIVEKFNEKLFNPREIRQLSVVYAKTAETSIIEQLNSGKISLSTAEQLLKGVEKAEADKARFEQFAQSIGYSVEGALTSAIVQSLEGDFDPQSILKGLGSSLIALGVAFEFQIAKSVAAGIAEGTAAGASGFGAIAIGAGLIGASNSGLFGGSKDSKTKLSFDEKGQRAFDDLIATINKNNEILLLTSPGTAAVQTRATLEAEASRLRGLTGISETASLQDIQNQAELLDALANLTIPLADPENVKNLYLLADVQEQIVKDQIGDQKDLSKYYDLTAKKAAEIIKSQGGGNINTFLDRLAVAGEKANDIFYGLTEESLTQMEEKLLEIARNAPEAVDALKSMNDEISSAADNFISMAKTLSDVQDNQQGFIDKNTSLVLNGQQTLDYYKDRLAVEDDEADKLRDRIKLGEATADNIAQLAKEEQDVLNIADLLTQAYTTQFGSTEAATTGIQGVLDLVKENQGQTFTLEQQMLTEAQTTNTLLTDVVTYTKETRDAIVQYNEEQRNLARSRGNYSQFAGTYL